MFNWLDNWLGRITMYRLVLYVLMIFWLAGLVFSALGILSYSPLAFLLVGVFLLLACWLTNWLLAWWFAVPVNVESVYITWLILALIITPKTFTPAYYWFLFSVAVLAMASKFILTIKRQHLFNPAALAVAFTYLLIDQSASWWIGTSVMFPLVAVGGFLLVRKLQRFQLVGTFLVVALASRVGFIWSQGGDPLSVLRYLLLDSAIIFFATVMLTEPQTMPASWRGRILYGALVGILFAPFVHLGNSTITPELALLVGNFFAYLLAPRAKFGLTLKSKTELSSAIQHFNFATDRPVEFKPGQYLEYTLLHFPSDLRGNRRYFTIASSPTENTIGLGVHFSPPENSSSFKRTLLALPPGSTMTAGQLAGDFVLPADPRQKLVFIAGGVGITPFRSMVKYLLDHNERRTVTLFYAARTAAGLVYKDIFAEAEKQLGMKTIYAVSEMGQRLDVATIKANVPDYAERTFYLSGPRKMVQAFQGMLKQLGIKSGQIKTDFFPGFA